MGGAVPLPLLITAGLLLVAATTAAWVLLRTSGQDKLVTERIEAVTAAGRVRSTVALPSITRKEERPAADWRERLTGLLGFSLSRTDQYSLAWPWVVGIGLAAGRIAVLMADGMFGSLAWVLQPVVTIAVCRSMFGTMQLKRVSKLRAQFPDALGLIVRAVRVGVPVAEALRAVSREAMEPTATEFERLASKIAIGTSLDTALREMAERNNLPEYGFFAAALGLQAQTGGGLSETLELLADVTRKRVAMKARGHALSAEARTSSMILGGLPLVSGASLYLINPDYMGILFFDQTGRMILGAALLSLSVGVFVMRMIIRKSLS